MRTSRFMISTLKEAPADAEVISQQLMLRSGMIKRLAAGIYSWMPLGLLVLNKVTAIVRDEMNRAGALELLMPAVQPAEIWAESGRLERYGPELLRLKDRHQRDFVFGPTHEEVVTDIVRKEIKSYRQLPLTLYQIQGKFRDEIRPRFGVMRGREFIMKDAYSFHVDYDDLVREYQSMYTTYSRIFTRLGLSFRAVAADTGSIGGSGSHEFHVMAEAGEDAIAWCPDSDYAANVELAEAVAPPAETPPSPLPTLSQLATPTAKTCADVATQLACPLSRVVKTLVVMAKDQNGDESPTMVLLRGDHSLNPIKLNKVPGISEHRLASAAEVVTHFDAEPGSIGPVAVAKPMRRVIDRSVAAMATMICGANRSGYHLTGVVFGRDLPLPAADEIADIRQVVDGDPSPDGCGQLQISRGIEVGHIFQLRKKYAEAMRCEFLDAKGEMQTMEMGCYGIGITRIVAAAIEQHHDERGIVFPSPLAPFAVAIVPMNYHKSSAVKQAADALYTALEAAKIDVLLDDRDERAGVLFADADLLGIPWRLVVGERGLKNGEIECKARTASEAVQLPVAEVVAWLGQRLQG